jgi:hypothetical protein
VGDRERDRGGQDEERAQDQVAADLRGELLEAQGIDCRTKVLGLPAALACPHIVAVRQGRPHPSRNRCDADAGVGDDPDEVRLPCVAVEDGRLGGTEEHGAVLGRVPARAVCNPDDAEGRQIVSGQPDRVT